MIHYLKVASVVNAGDTDQVIEIKPGGILEKLSHREKALAFDDNTGAITYRYSIGEEVSNLFGNFMPTKQRGHNQSFS